jgi:uncharacterized membrane protein (DUF485 family)
MTDDVHAAVEAIARRHRHIAFWIVGTILVLYLGLILMIAFAKPFLSRIVTPGLSLAILFGAIVTIAAWLLTLAYIGWANRYYDPVVRGRQR